MRIAFYLKEPARKDKPGSDQKLTPLVASISYGGYRLRYYISESIAPKYWNAESQKAKQNKQFPEFPEFNQRLENFRTLTKNIIRRYMNDNSNTPPAPDVLKTFLDKEMKHFGPRKDMVKNLFGFFADLIEQMERGSRIQPVTGKPFTRSTIQVYRNTLNRLRSFETFTGRNLNFPSIDLEFYADFTEYMSKELLLATNTIGKDIKIIKVVMGEAEERGLHNNTQYKSRKFSTTSEETDSIYLTDAEIKAIIALDLSEAPRTEAVRDIFIVGCYTGLRFSDFSSLTPDQIADGFIKIKEQIKTGNPVTIPVHPEVQKIINKYQGSLPPAFSNAETNKRLKAIGRAVKLLEQPAYKTITKGGKRITLSFKKADLLCTHTARRTFATNEYLNGTPSITIMAITGHRTEKAFLRYIKLTPDEHAKLLQAHWGERNQLKAI